jgi:hypothetical protein
MLTEEEATIIKLVGCRPGLQEVETEYGPAICYVDLSGTLQPGDRVLINRTAVLLGLGTGGYDFVIARIGAVSQGDRPCDAPTSAAPTAGPADGHIVKLRYTPLQHTVRTLEEDPANAPVWRKRLDRMPVLVGQLHSQIAPAAAALALREKRCAYIMTDGAALPLAFSRLAASLKESRLIAHTITAGQAFGGDYETVTVHSALLAAKHMLHCDAAIVCQGPGNAGTGTKYGYSGIEQCSLLDTAAALGGTPIAVIRASEADRRKRHAGISHHTLTSLELVRSRCLVALPPHVDHGAVDERHDVRIVDGAGAALDLLIARGVDVTTMGRVVDEDRLFFEAAAAAGLLAGEIIESLS